MQQLSEGTLRAILLRLSVVLAGLLIVLTSLALLFIIFLVLQRFGNVFVLFTLGAILAYVLNPAVNRATALLEKRWAGIAAAYGAVLATLAVLVVLLFHPLLTQSSSLVNSFSYPSPASLRPLSHIQTQAALIETELRGLEQTAARGNKLPPLRVLEEKVHVAVLQRDVAAVETGRVEQAHRWSDHRGAAVPQPQLRVPPTYLAPLAASTAALALHYDQAVQNPRAPDSPLLGHSVSDTAAIVLNTKRLHHTLSVTPIPLLDAQTWADQHHIDVDVQKSAGQVVKKVTDQALSILNNTASVLSTTGTLLVDLTLILLISLYFVSDGANMIQRGLEIVPDRHRKEADFFVDSVDSVLGKSIRANLALAGVAGVLGWGGAAALSVPYAVLIGVSTFVLELVPVIGPVILVIPPFVIALLFSAPTRAIILLIWFILFQQLVTNVIGPRVTSKTVGIHPLEAMAAALVGYPLAGFLGSFLAVPMVGLVHVLARQGYASWKAREAASADSEESVAQPPSDAPVLPPGGSMGAEAYAATGSRQ